MDILPDIDPRLRYQIEKEHGGAMHTFLLNRMFIGWQILDLNFRVVWANRTTCDIMGYGYDDYLGKNALTDMTSKDFQEQQFKNMMITDFNRGYSDPYNVEAIKKDGSSIHLEAQVYVIYEDDDREKEPVGVGCIFIDKSYEHALKERLNLATETFQQLTRQRLIEKPGKKTMTNAELMDRFGFTQAQACIAQSIAKGMQSKEIAEGLGIGVRTVESHRRHIRKKMGITGTSIDLASHLIAVLNYRPT